MEKVVDLFGVGEANYQKPLQKGNDLSQIQQGLFIGSVAEATNKDLLKSSNVTHILTVAVACAPPYPDDFVYKVIEVADRSETDLTVYFDECFSFIDQAIQSGGGVLVHCFMGMSRSVTIVVAYLMKKHGMGFSKAMELVKSRRVLRRRLILVSFRSCSNLKNPSKVRTPNSPQAAALLKLIQSTCYLIWRERNARIFASTDSSTTGIQASLDRSIRDRLLSIPPSSSCSVSLLAFYFGCISFPL